MDPFRNSQAIFQKLSGIRVHIQMQYPLHSMHTRMIESQRMTEMEIANLIHFLPTSETDQNHYLTQLPQTSQERATQTPKAKKI